MPNTWFTADLHLWHDKEFIWKARGYSCIADMVEGVIAKHNSLVHQNDSVYFIGDVAFCNSKLLSDTIRKMHGIKFCILGNHDGGWNKHGSPNCFAWVKDVHLLKRHVPGFGEDRIKIWLSHYRHTVWPDSHFGSLHAHGHSHGTLPALPGRAIDVGWDVWGRPLELVEFVSKALPLEIFLPVNR